MKIMQKTIMDLDEEIDVYDITINHECHNFLLDSGVVVHNCCESCHDGVASSSSLTVFANSKGVCRIGDSVSCGSTMIEGSTDTFAGD